MSSSHNVCITGYGLLSSLPLDNRQLWQALNQFSQTPSTINTTEFSPYIYHPLVAYDVEQQIPKPSDRRIMGKTMQSAVYTAGIALEQAQLKDKPDLLQDTQIIVALRGGERDSVADEAIVAACDAANEYEENLNKGLMVQLRPTLFLSQLPNLLAANIALLFGLTGSSLTLMGGEISGAQAIQLAFSRIKSGQAQRVLVGGVSINDSHEIITAFAQMQKLQTAPFIPLWQREHDHLCLGNASGFLILESEAAARARGATILAKLSQSEILMNADGLLSKAENILTMSHRPEKILSSNHDQCVRGITSATGTILEAAMPVGIILAVQCLAHKTLFAPLDASGIEKPAARQDLTKLWVHCAGQPHGHGLTCVEVA